MSHHGRRMFFVLLCLSLTLLPVKTSAISRDASSQSSGFGSVFSFAKSSVAGAFGSTKDFYKPLFERTFDVYFDIGVFALKGADVLARGGEAFGNAMLDSYAHNITLTGLAWNDGYDEVASSVVSIKGFFAPQNKDTTGHLASVKKSSAPLTLESADNTNSNKNIFSIFGEAIDIIASPGDFFIQSEIGALQKTGELWGEGFIKVSSAFSGAQNLAANATDALGNFGHEAISFFSPETSDDAKISNSELDYSAKNSIAGLGDVWNKIIDAISDPLVPLFLPKNTATIYFGANQLQDKATSTVAVIPLSPDLSNSQRESARTTIERIISTPGLTKEEMLASLASLKTEILSLTSVLVQNQMASVPRFGGFAGPSVTTVSNTATGGSGTFTGTFTGTLALSSGDGPLQANAGAITATTSIGVLYGGTGLTAAPAYGQMLVGNALSGYTLTATSSLGITSSPGGSD